jgi:beta-glucanase (GH16 family)
VRARLAFAAIAVTAVLAILGWGLFPNSANIKTSGHHSASARPPKSPFLSAATMPNVSSMRLAFESNFAGSKLDKSIWATCYPWVADPAHGCTNFSNPEREWYMPSQVRVANGELNIAAQPIATPGYTRKGARQVYACRSGMVTTYPSFNFKYGFVQAVARIPAGAGLWPGLWLAASNRSWPPEMDLIEHWGSPRNASGVYFHPTGGFQVRVLFPKSAKPTAGWHTFGLSWTSSELTWYFDGQILMTVRQHIPHQKMYFVADIANFLTSRGPVPCSGTLDIRSVKIWQE